MYTQMNSRIGIGLARKLSRLNDRKSVNIRNMNRLTIASTPGLWRGPIAILEFICVYKHVVAAWLAFGAVTLTAAQETDDFTSLLPKDATSAVCYLMPAEGHAIQGKVTFVQKDGGVEIEGEFTGLKPGKYGFAVYEKGDCSAEDASSVGSYFNPTQQPHGSPEATTRELGNLGNVEADKNGKAHYSRFDKSISLHGPNSIVGRGLVIHAEEDTFTPGNPPKTRVACGVILAVE